MVQLVG